METNIYINGEMIPVNPKKWTYKVRGDNTNHILLGVGEIAIPRIPKLSTLGWSSLFPKDLSEPFVNPQSSGKTPIQWKNTILMYLQKKTVLDLTITNDRQEEYVSYPVVIDSFNFEERGGETGDLYYDISFSQYREYQPANTYIVNYEDTDSSVWESGSGTVEVFSGDAETNAQIDLVEERKRESNSREKNYSGSFYVFLNVNGKSELRSYNMDSGKIHVDAIEEIEGKKYIRATYKFDPAKYIKEAKLSVYSVPYDRTIYISEDQIESLEIYPEYLEFLSDMTDN